MTEDLSYPAVTEEQDLFYPAGTLGFGLGELLEPIVERGEDPAGHFRSIIWFPPTKEAEARAFAAKYGYVLRENVPL